MEEENPGTVAVFLNDPFLRQFHLAVGNLLDYFSTSPFYDEQSINEQARQNRTMDLESMLQSMDGTSFRINMAQAHNGIVLEGDALKLPANRFVEIDPGMAIIDKVIKTGPDVALLARYYVMNACVYQAPDLFSLLSARTRSAMFHVREALREVKNMFNWSLESGFQKKLAAGETETAYVFSEGELREMATELTDEFQLQSALLDALLSEIGTS
jgi:mediator of RNA polymerase II transcription subunit 6